MATKLIQSNYISGEGLNQIGAEVEKQIEDAVQFAQSSPDPKPEDVLTDVFAD